VRSAPRELITRFAVNSECRFQIACIRSRAGVWRSIGHLICRCAGLRLAAAGLNSRKNSRAVFLHMCDLSATFANVASVLVAAGGERYGELAFFGGLRPATAHSSSTRAALQLAGRTL
jgi:hypothetical protein